MEPVEAGKSLGARTAEGGRRKAPACSDRRQETAASFPISQIRVAFDVPPPESDPHGPRKLEGRSGRARQGWMINDGR